MPSYLYNGDPYTRKTVSLYWDCTWVQGKGEQNLVDYSIYDRGTDLVIL